MLILQVQWAGVKNGCSTHKDDWFSAESDDSTIRGFALTIIWMPVKLEVVLLRGRSAYVSPAGQNYRASTQARIDRGELQNSLFPPELSRLSEPVSIILLQGQSLASSPDAGELAD